MQLLRVELIQHPVSDEDTTRGKRVTIRLRGRFDFHAYRRFTEAYKCAISNLGAVSIDVDLSRVAYIDSSALGMLLIARKAMVPFDGELRLVAPSSVVADVLEIAAFGKLFKIT